MNFKKGLVYCKLDLLNPRLFLKEINGIMVSDSQIDRIKILS